MTVVTGRVSTAITIGGVTVVVHTSDPAFLRILEQRYEGFTSDAASGDYEFEVDLIPSGATVSADADLSVRREAGHWRMERGDFLATWDPLSRRGRIRQSANPYSIDSVLRIVHTLVLAREGGFLLHAGSVLRNGRAFLFSGVSGAGKTTITRLAPEDATLLTDELSYVRKEADGYYAYGTPFAGELAKVGENVRAPLAAVYLLAQGADNRIDELPRAQAARALLRNVLFFAADDAELSQRLFQFTCDFVERVPVHRLTFVPDARVWELIQ
jgi:hypothetical protein